MDCVQHILKNVSTFLPIIAPIFLVYSREASASLRLWLAAQELPVCDAPQDTAFESGWAAFKRQLNLKDAAHKDAFRSVFLMAWTTWVAMIGYMLFKAANPWADIFYYITLVPIGAWLISRYFNEFMNLDDRVVYRNARGWPVAVWTRRQDVRKYTKIVSLVVGTVLACGAVRGQTVFHVALFYFAALHTFVQSNAIVRTRYFKCVLIIPGYLSIMLAMSATIGVLGKEKLPISLFEYTDLPEGSVDWTMLMFSIFWAFMQSELILICYRFDYFNAKSSPAVEIAPEYITERVNAATGKVLRGDDSTTTSDEIVTGIRVPTKLDGTFAKPYYTTVLACWAATNTMLFALSPSVFDIRRYEAYAYYLVWTASPILLAGVISLAFARGELNQLWRYSEEWVRKPEPSPSKESVSTEKEPLLPSHGKTGAIV